MIKLGSRTFGNKEELVFLGREISEERDYSESTANEIDQEVSRFIDDSGKIAEKIITGKKETLEKIVVVLLEKETIEKDEFNEIIGK